MRFECVTQGQVVEVCVCVCVCVSLSLKSSSVPSILIHKCIMDGLEKSENVQPLDNLRHFTQPWLPGGRAGTSKSIYT